MLYFQEDELTYNALEKDIAVLNLYFGVSTVQGDMKFQSCNRKIHVQCYFTQNIRSHSG